MLRRTVSVSRVQFELGAQNETFFVSEFAFHLHLFLLQRRRKSRMS